MIDPKERYRMSDMMKRETVIRTGLRALDLSDEEADVYLALLRAPATPLTLSRDTGIKRTKMYHLLEVLEKRSLVTRHTDDRGTFFVATEPTNLGIGLGEREAKLQEEQHILSQLVP